MATDMIVDLRALAVDVLLDAAEDVVAVRRATLGDQARLREFVLREFDEVWARGVDVAYRRQPISAFVAVDADAIVGFALYDIAFLGYFGPTGVAEKGRGNGIGRRLLLFALQDMRTKGYAYAVIGDVGPIEFYEKVCGAIVIGPPDVERPA